MGMGYSKDEDFIKSAKDGAALTEEEKEAIRLLELSSANSAMTAKQKAQKDASERLYNQTYGMQATALDTIRRSNAEAIATGASKGVQAANELSSILGVQTTTSDEATLLADQDYALADEYESSLLEANKTAETNIAAKETANLTDIMAGLATKYQADTEFALTPSPDKINNYLAEGNEAAAESVYFQLNPTKQPSDWDLYRAQIMATQTANNPDASAEEKAKTLADAKAAEEEAANADYTFARLKNPSGLNRGGDTFTSITETGKEHRLITQNQFFNIKLADEAGGAAVKAKINKAAVGQLFVINNTLTVKDKNGSLRTVTGANYNSAYNEIKNSSKYNLGEIGVRVKQKEKDDFGPKVDIGSYHSWEL